MRDEFAVVFKNDPNRSRPPVFEGGKEETLAWLNDRAIENGTLQVYDKDLREYFDVPVWLQKHEVVMTPEQRMNHENLTDPLVHARNEMVRQHVRRAIRLANESNYDSAYLEETIAYEIIRLFY